MKFLVAIAAFVIASGTALPAGPPVAPHGHAPAYQDTPPVYQYAYAVQDDYAGTNFAQNEARDGYATQGEYHVALPDGRIQTVKYRVDDAYSGYVADVSYSGTPSYGPAPKPHGPAPHGPAPHAPLPHGR